MFDIHTEPRAPQPLQAIIARVAPPFLLFSSVLCLAFLMSYSMFIPRFTSFRTADGSAMSPREVARHVQRLSATIAQQEADRERLVLPLTHEVYQSLKEQKYAAVNAINVHTHLEQVAARVGEDRDAIHLSSIDVDGETVTITGDVRNVGTRSMTVLAAFVEELHRQSFVRDLVRPAFTREGATASGFHSPFTVRFTLVMP